MSPVAGLAALGLGILAVEAVEWWAEFPPAWQAWQERASKLLPCSPHWLSKGLVCVVQQRGMMRAARQASQVPLAGGRVKCTMHVVAFGVGSTLWMEVKGTRCSLLRHHSQLPPQRLTQTPHRAHLPQRRHLDLPHCPHTACIGLWLCVAVPSTGQSWLIGCPTRSSAAGLNFGPVAVPFLPRQVAAARPSPFLQIRWHSAQASLCVQHLLPTPSLKHLLRSVQRSVLQDIRLLPLSKRPVL